MLAYLNNLLGKESALLVWLVWLVAMYCGCRCWAAKVVFLVGLRDLCAKMHRGAKSLNSCAMQDSKRYVLIKNFRIGFFYLMIELSEREPMSEFLVAILNERHT